MWTTLCYYCWRKTNEARKWKMEECSERQYSASSFCRAHWDQQTQEKYCTRVQCTFCFTDLFIRTSGGHSEDMVKGCNEITNPACVNQCRAFSNEGVRCTNPRKIYSGTKIPTWGTRAKGCAKGYTYSSLPCTRKGEVAKVKVKVGRGGWQRSDS